MTGGRPTVAVVIPAGGSGTRMGSDKRKQYLELAGTPILLRSLRPFLEHPAVHQVVVALPPEDAVSPPAFMPEGVVIVPGGRSRGDSVGRGLDTVRRDVDLVLIHDAARPLLSRALLDRVLQVAAAGVGAVPALPVSDTLKRAGQGGDVRETLDRAGIWAVQTPQGFPRDMILDAYRRAAEDGVAATDDAALVERLGGPVRLVPGDPENLKITGPVDLALAETILAVRKSS
jgi:2-C-methyl-D-erythritol 4-phosphate cytidylyltransferase